MKGFGAALKAFFVATTATAVVRIPQNRGAYQLKPGVQFVYMTEPLAKITDPTESSRKLVEFTRTEFLKKEVLKVTENIYLAIGYALGNSIMIEGNDGIIIVDTTESVNSMKEIMTEFRKITHKPVKAIILTHFHSDHILGSSYIIDEEKRANPNVTIKIFSHEKTKEFMFGFFDTYDIGLARGIRQLGAIVPKIEGMRTGSGIGPELLADTNVNLYIPTPTVTYIGRATYTVAGIEFELIYTPGETEDQTTVWISKDRVILPGDNIYKTFPNLYAIRGSPARNSKQWYKSLDRLRELKGKYLIGSHTRPVVGEELVEDTLLIYRDAIKYVHDQTVRLLNKGYFPGHIVEEVKLPDNVAKHPHLQEHYGSVPWSIRGVFTNYLGWFSGNPRDLHPMTESDHAKRMVRLVTYAQIRKDDPVEVILQEAQISHERSYNHYLLNGKHLLSDDKWALELADTVLAIGTVKKQLAEIAMKIKVSALRAIGVEQVSANGRNYYLTYAMELENGISLDRTKAATGFVINSSPIRRVLDMLCAKVNGLTCQHRNFTIGLKFTDVGKDIIVTLRNSVCDILEPPPRGSKPHVQLATSSETFKAIKAEDLILDTEVAFGNVKVLSGSIETYKEFLECFDPLNLV